MMIDVFPRINNIFDFLFIIIRLSYEKLFLSEADYNVMQTRNVYSPRSYQLHLTLLGGQAQEVVPGSNRR
jgi:hypothetical protein